ncbi:SPASM domain-containing protein [Patescibacteria group bacterium]|nr:SPASM domain-containing protein [Patescibacteria group bacterium]
MITLCQLRHKSGLIFGTSGEIIACNSLFDYPLGEFGKDFSKGEELLSFLNSTSVVNSFSRLNNYPSEKCVSCKKHSLCGGGCVMLWSVYKADEVITGFD